MRLAFISFGGAGKAEMAYMAYMAYISRVLANIGQSIGQVICDRASGFALQPAHSPLSVAHLSGNALLLCNFVLRLVFSAMFLADAMSPPRLETGGRAALAEDPGS